MLLQDKVVIVSGIGPGLGIKLAVLAAEQGAKGVVVAARTSAKLDEAEQQVKQVGTNTQVVKVVTDITDRSACDALVSAAVNTFGRVDCLINSAYDPCRHDPIESANLDDWRKTMEVNLFGSLNLTQAVIPQMKTQGSGSIVMINTMETRKPLARQGGYGASKAALTSATAHLALELGRYGIRVNSAYMGWMWGAPVEYYVKSMAKHKGVAAEEIKKGIAKNIPLGHIPADYDCGKAAIFLASDYACAITGACLDVNGGEFMPH